MCIVRPGAKPEVKLNASPMTAQARVLVAAAASRYGDLDITAVERPYRDVAGSDGVDVRRASSVTAGQPR
jgi:hypothetical protein